MTTGLAESAHTHAIADVTNLQPSLDGKAASAHTHSAADITSGSLPTARIEDAAITPAKLSGAQSGTAPVFGVRAWCRFNGTTTGTNAPAAGGNVTSVTRNGTGDYTVNFTTALPDTSFCVVVSAGDATGTPTSNGRMIGFGGSAFTTSSCRFSVFSQSNVANDSPVINVIVIR
jgi:hypothetical protein